MIKLLLLSLTLPLLPNIPLKWYASGALIIFATTISIILLYSPSFAPQIIIKGISVDSLRAPLITLTMWISALIILASQSVKINNNKQGLLSIVILILNTTLMLAFLINHFILFYMFFEASLVPTLILILIWGYQPERLQAGTYLILYTVTASLPLLVNLLIINNKTGHINTLISCWCAPQLTSHYFILLWWVSCTLAFLVKLPLYTVHLWLPKAHVEAPVAGSIILAGLLLKLGSYGLLRIAEKMRTRLNIIISPYFLPLSIWGAVATRLICLRQSDLKSLIAYSSVGHIGLLLAGLLSNSVWGWQGTLGISLAHGLCSSALFALANITYETTQTRSLFLTKGLQTIFPTITIWWFIFAARNMAAPPTINLLSEIILISRVVSISYVMILPLIAIRFLAAAYSLTLFTSTQHGNISQSINPIPARPSSNYIILTAHVVPMVRLILSPELVTIWV